MAPGPPVHTGTSATLSPANQGAQMSSNDKTTEAEIEAAHGSRPGRLCRMALLASLGLGAGCYSTSLMQEPDVLAPGKVRASVGASYDVDTKGGEATPTPEVAVRVGV